MDGKDFIEANEKTLLISDAALENISKFLDIRRPSKEEAIEMFNNSVQITQDELLDAGFNPKPQNPNANSWYFRIDVLGKNLIAVLTDGRYNDGVVWITTYSRPATKQPISNEPHSNRGTVKRLVLHIHSCKQCPLKRIDKEDNVIYCSHKAADDDNIIVSTTVIKTMGDVLPDWCPLPEAKNDNRRSRREERD